jgi:hypothetical protein
MVTGKPQWLMIWRDCMSFYLDDVVVEFPQSGERISGKHNIYQLREHYPTKYDFKS